MTEKTLRTNRHSAHSSWEAALHRFLSSLLDEGLSATTLAGYRADLVHFHRWCESRKGRAVAPADLEPGDLGDYQSHWTRAKPRKPATINRRIESLKRFFRWAAREGMVTEDFSSCLKRVAVLKRARPEGLKRREVNAMLRAAGQSPCGFSDRNTALVQLILQTGVRLREVSELRLGDVALRPRSGTVRIRKGNRNMARTVPLNALARAALGRYLQGRSQEGAGAFLFVGQRGGRLTPRGIETIISATAGRAGLPKGRVTADRLRHTFALEFLGEHPDDLKALAAILGHRSAESTSVYAAARGARK